MSNDLGINETAILAEKLWDTFHAYPVDTLH